MASGKRFYELTLRDRPLYFGDFGQNLHIGGVIFEGNGEEVVVLVPDSSIDPDRWQATGVRHVSPTLEEWSDLLKQSDDPVFFQLDESGTIKAVHRKVRFQISGAVQQRIWVRDELQCVYCERPMGEVTLTIDHWMPLELDGANDETNYLSACRKCNKRKGDLHPREWCRQMYGDRAAYMFERFTEYLQSSSSIAS
jgi:hypothetical protein